MRASEFIVEVGLPRLKPQNPQEIADLYASGFSASDIAKDYNITNAAVSNIKTGTSWGWLTGKEYKKPNIKEKKILNETEIYEIIEKRKNGFTLDKLSKEYECGKTTIRDNIKKYSK